MYIILPAHLENKLGHLPKWYGITLMVYGFVVILTQLHAISKKFFISLLSSIIALGFSCLILTTPSLFCVETMGGALLWVFLLALEEIFAPYIDFYAAKAKALLVKELSIGLGGGICILLANYLNNYVWIGILSVVMIIIGSLMHANAKRI